MRDLPTIVEVIAWLRDRDEPAMSLVVERLEAELRQTQATSKRNYDAWHALHVKHEPQPRRDYAPTWTGD